MQRKKTFVVVCVSILALTKLSAQPAQTLPFPPVPVAHFDLSWLPAPAPFSIALLRPSHSFYVPTPFAVPPFTPETVIYPPAPVPSIGSDYYTQHFGFFCQKELQLQKMTGIPFRFRLGSLEQTNFLEGK
ncbi:MAG TPA: hypothetical protein VNU72_03645 [Puia sp.]|nr:hypothetical protein [Puia sp.]